MNTSSSLVLDIAQLSIPLPDGGDRAWAVKDINLQVLRGQILCLVGESGSGKSMIAQTVMGLAPSGLCANQGSIRLLGEDVLRVSANRLRQLRGSSMAMIFQEPMTALNPVMRCGDQIDEMLRQHTKLSGSERRTKVMASLEEVGLVDIERSMRSYPHQLSGGQRQRIMIAMALILSPALLIADEPTTALDVTTQAQILRLIKELQQQRGTGVLFITHDFGVVSEIASRVAVLQTGILVEEGTCAEVLDRPQHPYTRELISAVPSMLPPSALPGADHRDPASATGTQDKAVPLLSVKHLHKTYPGGGWFRKKPLAPAVRSVDFDIMRGKTLGIVGESGSGKSTVARCVTRLINPTSGEIHIGGQDIARLNRSALHPIRKRIQMVFQDPYRSLNPRRTIEAALVEGPMNYGVSREEAIERTYTMLKLVHLSADALARYPHQFSGGQRQRICIARALIMRPDILVADEAVSALDVSVQARVLALLAEIRLELGLTLLFITHDLRVAAQICDHVMVMKQGEVVEYDTVQKIFQTPQHPYTQALLAAAPGWRHTAP